MVATSQAQTSAAEAARLADPLGLSNPDGQAVPLEVRVVGYGPIVEIDPPTDAQRIDALTTRLELAERSARQFDRFWEILSAVIWGLGVGMLGIVFIKALAR
jgi:hypothetical protein